MAASDSPSAARPESLWSIVSGARPDEREALLLAFVQFFCVLASYYLLRPVRDQLSAAVGSTNLWQFWVGTFLVMLALVPVFGALVARWPREKFIPATYAFFIVCLLAFVPAFQMQDRIGARTLGIVFYVWLSVFNLYVVSVFWSFMADLFDGLQARRMFPVIAVGGTLGAIFGPIMASLLSIDGLLLGAIALLLVAIVCTWRLADWSRRHPHPQRQDELEDGGVIGGSVLAGLVQVLKSPFLRTMIALMLLGDAIGTVAYSLTADVVAGEATTAEARKTLYAHIDLMANSLQLFLQIVVTKALLADFGVVGVLVADALIKLAALIETAIIGAPMVIPMLVVTRGSTYGIGKPGSDALYARAEREARYKGKNTIETAGWRFGDVVVSLSMKALGGSGIGVVGYSLICMVAASLGGWLGWRAAHAPELAPEDPSLQQTTDAS
ncbi:MAG TPA: translocase [Xanthomonadaceae bacterium]|jgi:AAA family ATP:ADP antiporter